MSEWFREQFLIEWPNVWADRGWTVPACVVGGALFLLILWAYRSIQAPLWLKFTCAAFKTLAVLLLAAILVEPMRSESKPVPGANLFAVLADRSQSLQIADRGESSSRADKLKPQLERSAPWQVALGQQFDVRRYEFDRQLAPVADFQAFAPDGEGSSIVAALTGVAERYAERPIAGILLFTDGNATDFSDKTIDWSQSPPIFPVVLGAERTASDIGIRRVTASQTNFEAAPVTITAELEGDGFAGKSVTVELLDEKGERQQTQTVSDVRDGQLFSVRFQVKPTERGVIFYQVRAYAKGEEESLEDPTKSDEATLLNNQRIAVVNRGQGPYKVLYVSGRPNWEFKFLNRSLAEDDEIKLDALVRIAKREAKFQFRDKDSSANRIFTNSDDEKKEQVEQYDEAVLLRVGKLQPGELSGGFPKSSDELFQYHAIILDDLEADFFTQEQKSLIQDFVSLRGGGFLMLGGTESFAEGQFHRTPIGELLPVYLSGVQNPPQQTEFGLEMTREGLLEPWVRVRATEQEEEKRFEEMPQLRTLNSVGALKPGATQLLATPIGESETRPVLVTQRFGKGRTAALMLGDLWRWKLHQDSPDNEDLEKAWRQTIRWLVGDVPQRVKVEANRRTADPNRPVEIAVEVNDENFKPLDNANVTIEVSTPDGETLTLTAQPKDAVSGKYASTYVPRTPGAYRANVIAYNPDGSEIQQTETGWVAEPASEEFATLKPNRDFLEMIAQKSGGEVVPLDNLDAFVATLPDREIPIVEPKIHSVWHTWGVFLLAIVLLVGEWGLRRWKGLA
ncbi:glutamine amidotransferase [Blastopirellula sp. JC732]|uniref:Glutamine amidotransferase n=1 Tax=Blastopirellula sediminis TaxID=2894196 RepID=A0A9X1SEI0_9BACT|nr:glutamine amidotransferase [Blastopirellula sediminis]MCC9607999.1 glutamine amidotransferase [Blastopirellula sediminis]MCC9627208.1 glutamine amidotransferase [Blastopirellula sediminis]